MTRTDAYLLLDPTNRMMVPTMMPRLLLVLLVACSAPPRAPAPNPVVEKPTVAEPPPARDVEVEKLKVLHSFPGIDLVESSNAAIHEHGGDAAHITSVMLVFDIHDRRAHEIEAKQIEMLRKHCTEAEWHTRTVLKIAGYEASTAGGANGVVGDARLLLPAGEPRRYRVSVRFSSVDAYQACDAFGFAIDLVVDRVRHRFELPLDVSRIEPMRP